MAKNTQLTALAVNAEANAFAALVTAATTGGKMQTPMFNKTGVAGTAIGGCIDLWAQGALASGDMHDIELEEFTMMAAAMLDDGWREAA